MAYVEVIKGDPSDYKVGPKHTGRGWSPQCLEFDTVTHYSHVRNALNIVSDRKIKADLVYDNSSLNDKRIRVAWTSPKTWARGSRYGNIGFTFPLAQFLTNKQFYWIEVAKYKVPACRILIASKDKDYTSHGMSVYDPTSGSGPWWLDKADGKHYHNDNFCLEFMVEGDIQLDSTQALSFDSHNSDFCNMHRNSPQSCRDFKLTKVDGAAEFLAGLVAQGLTASQLQLGVVSAEGVKPSEDLVSAWWDIQQRIALGDQGGRIAWTGNVEASSASALPLANAVLSAIYRREQDDALRLAGFFKSGSHAIASLAAVIENKSGVIENSLPQNIEAKFGIRVR